MAGHEPSPVSASGRDIRLDLFRGLALWFIFLDHIPDNIVSWLTVRNYGFSDATEIFVFISGYTAVIAYSRMMARDGWVRAAARIYRRVWQLYVAHILLFVAFSAQIAWVSIARDTPALIEEMQLLGLGQNPYRALLAGGAAEVPPGQPRRAAALHRPAGVLPVRAAGGRALAVRGDCRLAGRLCGDLPLRLEPAGLPGKQGLVLQSDGLAGGLLCRAPSWPCWVPSFAWLDRFRWPLSVLALLYLLFSAFIALSWHYNSLERLIPDWLSSANLSHRQDQHRHPAVCALPGHRLAGPAGRPGQRRLSSGGGSSSHFAGAANTHCRYSVLVFSWRSVDRWLSGNMKIQSCRKSS